MPSGLSRCKCYASNEASNLLNKINIPVFQTNALILEFPRLETPMEMLCELQGLSRTSPQGALGMDEL